ncbi:C6 zinc finger domain-containing protein [Pleurostoma richardsiae]|uniref:C6 zinc finger domain-containing protein n=1 Tax=Pleurostoma richardsiae TaxID=41990 RepID=A0AA38S4G9_9PEZI|nr:C6 zinc finger domain-containing protein [Pleurostoma richardsiae]
MDQEHEPKRPRLTTTTGSWSAGPSHHGRSLPQLGSPLTTTHLPAPPPPPPPGQYQPPPHPFSRGPELPPPHPPSHPTLPHPPHFDDRRQHEPEPPYPPMQEHRHPPASPAHPPYPSYPPPRDPHVKRDPAEDTLPQLRRPSSTGNAPEAIPPGTSHGPMPPPAHLEERRHMSYDNGPPPPPPMYRHPSFPPPQTPLPPPSPYEQQMYAPPPGDLYSIAYAGSTAKRKAQRASQACDNCRQLKAKCDELKPCKTCKEKGVECKYRDPIPKQQDKATTDILEGIANLREMMQEVMHRVANLEGAKDVKVPIGEIPPHPDMTGYDQPGSPGPPAAEDTISSPGDHATITEAPIEQTEAVATIRQMVNEEEVDLPPGLPVPPGKPKMPSNHTTPAGHLLVWPSIREMLQPILDKENLKYPEDYPRRVELRRGQLSLFGRGEGHETLMVDRDGSADQGDIPDDTSVSDYPSPSQSSDWGQIGGMSPPGAFDVKGPTVLRMDGSLDFDSSRVWGYVASFEQHIQNMHPLIITKELHAMVRVFLDNLPQSRPSKPAPTAKFAEQSSQPYTDHERTGKRKRSPGPDSTEHHGSLKRGRPQRSIQTALVLLVLALGKICSVRDRKIPEPADYDTSLHGSPVVRNGLPTSPGQGSPPSSISQTSSLPSPKDQERMLPSRRSSFQAGTPLGQGPASYPKKNYDVIPGLEYFAFATDILGNHLGGTQLIHVQCHLLAGLYYGQLGRVIPSFSHIRHASATLMDNISSSMDRLQRRHPEYAEGKRDNQIAIAFWSCLQLESDILAELNLHPSGLLAYEETIPWPDGQILTKEFGFEERVVQSYYCQLYLRKRLNEIHGLLYDRTKSEVPTPLDSSTEADTIKDIERGILNTVWIHPSFQFQPDDPPAEDILSARIRAKWWGAQVITYRPFIRQILYFNHTRQNTVYTPQESGSGDFRSDVTVPFIHPSAKTPSEVPEEVVSNARKGINALIESTRAFHNLEDKRYIVTNVFGTAHAQWGNLVTLAAVHRDPILGQFVSEELLLDLLRKTIGFFKIVAHNSSCLAIDLRILMGLEKMISKRDMDPRTNSSFSSGTSAGPPFTPSGVPMQGVMPAPGTPVPPPYGHTTPMQM